MSGDDLTLRAKERVKFDESAFFRHLREKPKNSALLALLRSIDRRACLEMATYIIRYLKRWEEKRIMAERKRRGAEIKRALSAAITSLRRAAAQYRGVAAIRLPGGSLVTAGAPFWPEGSPFLADVLESEANRLTSLLTECKKLFNEKRFGVSANHLWLVMLQEFVAAWTEQELGTARQLKISDVVALVDAGKLTLGWNPKMSPTDSELIRKAIRNFRSNPANAWITGDGVKSYVRRRCQRVRNRPYLLGIEI
jgi:hypothetical protein